MSSILPLIQADPYDPAAVRHYLAAQGFADATETVAAVPRRYATVFRKKKAAPLSTPVEPGADRAERLLFDLVSREDLRPLLLPWLDDLLADLGEAPEPIRSLLNLAQYVDAVPDPAVLLQQLQHHAGVRRRLIHLFSFSQALADTLILQPELLECLQDSPLPRPRSELRRLAREAAAAAGSPPEAAFEALRRFRRRETLRIGLLDMETQSWRQKRHFADIVHQISDLAQVCVQESLRLLTGDVPPPLVVVAMGKLGARELNYSSDIDLIFIHTGDNHAMQTLGQNLLAVLSEASSAGTLYRVDMRLRPDGQSGALATSFNYALSYYESLAASWEWQAMIKSRIIAGDARLGRRFRHFTRAVIWARRPDDSHLRDMVALKQRAEARDQGSDPANVKEGPGGIRDAEWVVQQLQLMVGPSHRKARAQATLRAIDRLHELQALTAVEARELRQGYLFLRVLEHRLQLFSERAVRVLPSVFQERVALARRMGCHWRGRAAERWLSEEHQRHRREIRRLCDQLFWGWQEPATSEDTLKMLPPSVQPRLDRMVHGTDAHPVPGPLSRQLQVVLPEALVGLHRAADSERALSNLEQLCDASGNRLSLLRALGTQPSLSHAVFTILGGSQTLADTLIRFPELLELAATREQLTEPRRGEEARAECRSYCLTFRDRGAALRRWKRREMLRIGLRDLVLDASPHEIAGEIADLAQSCLMLACEEALAMNRLMSEMLAFALVGMGKLGGGEMHYASDCDVLFAYEGYDRLTTQSEAAALIGESVLTLMGEPTEEGVCFPVDPRLRPEGQSGPLVPSVQGYLRYFERETGGLAVWERQALTRARTVAGDTGVASRLLAAIRHVAYPEDWNPAWGDELRHIKQRVEQERAAHGSGSEVFDVKLGPGTLSDIEFTAQWLALKHGARHPAIQVPNTRQQLAAALQAGVLEAAAGEALQQAYTFFRRAELRLQISQDHARSAVRRDSPEFIIWARAATGAADPAAAVELFAGSWGEHAARVRAIMEYVRDSL